MAHTNPQFACHLGDLVDADALGNLIVIYVAGLLEALIQVDMTMAAALPTVEPTPPGAEVTRAPNRFVGGDHASLKRGQSGDHLEGGARRVKALNRLVGKRAELVRRQRTIISARDPAHKLVWVEAGRRGDAKKIAVAHIHDHGRCAFLAQSRLHEILKPMVNAKL